MLSRGMPSDYSLTKVLKWALQNCCAHSKLDGSILVDAWPGLNKIKFGPKATVENVHVHRAITIWHNVLYTIH